MWTGKERNIQQQFLKVMEKKVINLSKGLSLSICQGLKNETGGENRPQRQGARREPSGIAARSNSCDAQTPVRSQQ